MKSKQFFDVFGEMKQAAKKRIEIFVQIEFLALFLKNACISVCQFFEIF